MLTGPNGSGKSTLFRHYFSRWWRHSFINADLIARDELGAGADGATLQAIRIAHARKLEHLDRGVSFATEGLQVDTELLSLAKERGYRTRVVSVALAAPILNVVRVRQRVLTGGHNVPEAAIVRRYDRSLQSMLEGPRLADRVLLVDNSGLRYHFIARWKNGRLTRLHHKVPAWAETLFAAEFAAHRAIGS